MDNITLLLTLIVLGTSIWVLVDAITIGVKKGQIKGFTDAGPVGWFGLCLLLWIVGFPLYLAKRGEYIHINTKQKKKAKKNKENKENMNKQEVFVLKILAIIIAVVSLIGTFYYLTSNNPSMFVGMLVICAYCSLSIYLKFRTFENTGKVISKMAGNTGNTDKKKTADKKKNSNKKNSNNE